MNTGCPPAANVSRRAPPTGRHQPTPGGRRLRPVRHTGRRCLTLRGPERGWRCRRRRGAARRLPEPDVEILTRSAPAACPRSVSSGGGRPSTGRSRPWRSPAVGGAGVGPVSRSSRRAEELSCASHPPPSSPRRSCPARAGAHRPPRPQSGHTHPEATALARNLATGVLGRLETLLADPGPDLPAELRAPVALADALAEQAGKRATVTILDTPLARAWHAHPAGRRR